MLGRVLDYVHGDLVFGRRIAVLAAHIAAMLPMNAAVLDVGAGDGSLASALMARRPDLTITGIDVFVRDTTAIPVRHFDGERIPHPDKSVDVVLFVDVLHHTHNVDALLGEAARVARHSVVIKDHYGDGRVSKAVLRFMDWMGNARHGVVLPYHYQSRREWEGSLARAGLHPVAVRDALGIYIWPLTLLFDARLHFVAQLKPA